MKIGVVISTVNEAETIGALVTNLTGQGYVVFVVDASTDGTEQRAYEAGAAVLHLDAPKGIAWHLRTGWQMALDAHCDVIVQMDAGGSHDPEDAYNLLLQFAVLENRPDMVIGSRFIKSNCKHERGSQYIGNPTRAIMSRFAAWMCNNKKKRHWSDWTSGYRAFTAQAIATLLNCKYAATGHAFQIEVLDYANKLGMNIVEVPITYTAGRSSFNSDSAKEALMIYQLM